MANWSSSVAASADDAVELNTSMTLNGVTLRANSTTQISGMRFLNCTIPKNATITAATLTVNIQSTSYDDPDTVIRAQLGDAAAFGSGASDISNRTKTTASVNWSGTGVGAGAQNLTITTLVQEVVNDASWASGNDLALFVTGASASGDVRFYAYDNGSGAASISIDYVAATANPLRGPMPGATLRGKL